MPLKTAGKNANHSYFIFDFTDSTIVNTTESDPDSGMAKGRSF